MSVHGTKDDDNATRTAPGPEQQTANARMNAPGPTGSTGNGVTDLINMLGASQSLGGPIEEYLKTIKTYFGTEVGSALGKIEIRRLSEPNGAHAFISDKKAILMIFYDTVSADVINFSPTSDYAAYADRALRNQFGKDMELLNFVVIPPGDYSKAQQMAQYISVSLAIATNPKILGTDISVLGDSKYTIDPDVVAARNYIGLLNPSAVAPRVDIGFTIYQKQSRGNNAQLGPLEDSRPIAAVGGYTEILINRNHAGATKYLPMVHITAISSAIPLPGIIPLCMAVAADQFISTGRWLQPFSTFQKGKPNLGQLFPDVADPKKLWFTTDPAQLDGLRFQHFLPAVLAVDVAEGQARIPGLYAYGNLASSNSVYDQIQNFFGNRLQLDRSQAPYFVHACDYLGTYGDRAGNLVDSRHMDYVTLLADGSLDAGAQILQGYPQDIALRARVISDKTAGSFRSLNRTTISVLSPRLLATLAQAIQQILAIEAPLGQNRMSSTDWMQAEAELYRSQNFNVTRADTRGGYGFGVHYNL